MASLSSRYCARIRADAAARRCVLASAVMLASAGSLLLLQLPVAWPLRMLAGFACWTLSGLELWRTWRRYRSVAAFRLHADGSVDIEAPDGRCRAGEIAPGTVSLTNLAWFRCRGANGRAYAELIVRNTQERDDWRRFQVICRHVAAC